MDKTKIFRTIFIFIVIALATFSGYKITLKFKKEKVKPSVEAVIKDKNIIGKVISVNKKADKINVLVKVKEKDEKINVEISKQTIIVNKGNGNLLTEKNILLGLNIEVETEGEYSKDLIPNVLAKKVLIVQ
ncbi:MAG: hypothetical protein RR922_02825 [Clostridia bacterium]